MKKSRKKLSNAQILLTIHLRELGVDDVRTEYVIDHTRKWKADLALPTQAILIECDGGVHGTYDRVGRFVKERRGHKFGAALEDDYLKQNTAQLLGWRLLRFSNHQVLTGEAKNFMQRFLWETK